MVETDKQRLKSFYKDKGYADIEIDYEIEFFENNSVVIYFNINEGMYYQLQNVQFSNNTSNQNIDQLLNDFFINNKYENKTYNANIAEMIEKEISNLIKFSGIIFFEINNLVKLKQGKADLLFEIRETKPVYVNNININGNTRTLDYVVRRELEIIEGDSYTKTETDKVTEKIKSLGFFE
jgi:Outer membrane protein/protective antigen OMA87